MRYAIFTDIHANLEALEAVLAKIDEIKQQEQIDGIWFLGDLVGYGPNPNECITTLRERTDVIIAGNHDWAAVGKIDLEDFSEAARLSAEWTTEQLTAEHREFLANLPERIDMADCILVHGSPYGPLWEYLTSEVLAERSFQYFNTRYCFVGHTHVPVIFQQADIFANTPTAPLNIAEQNGLSEETAENQAKSITEDEDETTELAAIRPTLQNSKADMATESASILQTTADMADALASAQQHLDDDAPIPPNVETAPSENTTSTEEPSPTEEVKEVATIQPEEKELVQEAASVPEQANGDNEDNQEQSADASPVETITPEDAILNAEDRLNEEIEELLSLLGLSQSMVKVTNEMIIPPVGEWQAPENYRAIVNPGGVGQPRDGDPRAAFMIYDTERGFTFYRVPYSFEKTQEKIVKSGLPQYLATRLAYGR